MFPTEFVEIYTFKENVSIAQKDTSQIIPLTKIAIIKPEDESLEITTTLEIGKNTKAVNYTTIAIWELSDNGRVLIITERLNNTVSKTKSEVKEWVFNKIIE